MNFQSFSKWKFECLDQFDIRGVILELHVLHQIQNKTSPAK